MPVSLHNHSWYSLLEGPSSVESLVERALRCGYRALALTDSNNLLGAVTFSDLALRAGLRPLLGARLRQHRYRCTVLIADRQGYRNLCRILSRLHLGGKVSEVPATSLPELLAEFQQGLHVLVDDVHLAERLREPLGQRLWLEVIRPRPGSQAPLTHEGELLAAGQRLGIAPVASVAAGMATPAEYSLYRLLAAVRRGGLLAQLPALPITPDHHLVEPGEFRRRFRDLPDALRNTEVLAEQLRTDVLPHETVLPPCRIPRQLDAQRYLHLLCERGLRRRNLGDHLFARDRLRQELAIIEAGGLASYFLVVRDIALYARRRGHSMALRGSAGSSLVCYLLEITEVDPLRFGLSLDRFLHEGRPDLPDIDLDFDWKVRDEVIAHVMQRYGLRHTAMISSHLFLQPRSAFREAARVHGLSNEQISALLLELPERVETMVEGVDERILSLAELEDESEARGKNNTGVAHRTNLLQRICADARLLLGRPHHLSIHPGGVVITPQPLEEYVPLHLAPKGVIITQFDKDGIERIGLVKIDLLGNRALATVDEGMIHLRKATSTPRDSSDNPCSDPALLSLLRQGDTLGITQLESPAMRHLLIQMQPRGVEDVIQALALVRPGAGSDGRKEHFVRRRRGLERVPALHPRLDGLLAETEGLMLYEDNALQVIQALTGLAVPQSYRFYKRITRCRRDDELEPLWQEFRDLCLGQGIPGGLAAEQWLQLTRFRQYSFCKSHAVSYGLIAWREAWLKAHHPLAFWTAVLNNTQGSYPRRVYVEAIKRAGIELRRPCVNRSGETFHIEGDGIRVGLDAIATLPMEVRQRLLQERNRGGPYRDLADVQRRLQPGPEVLDVLIRCGALDFTGLSRPALYLESRLQQREQETQRRSGTTESLELFPASWLDLAGPWQPRDQTQQQRWHDEWELLGFLIGPPLMSLFRPRLPADLHTSRDLPTRTGRPVRLAGLVATARQARTSRGPTMQFITLEDEWGLVEVNLFPGRCPLLPHLELGPYLVEGTVEDHLGVLAITAGRIEKWQGK